jgi:predicted transcriptional regulator
MIQANLFAHEPPRGRSRKRDPDTAKAAARSVQVADLERRVLNLLVRTPSGLTTHEMSKTLGVELVSISPRMAPLRTKNLVRDSGERRLTDTGRKAIVWKCV